jgi:hypothetical protein
MPCEAGFVKGAPANGAFTAEAWFFQSGKIIFQPGAEFKAG